MQFKNMFVLVLVFLISAPVLVHAKDKKDKATETTQITAPVVTPVATPTPVVAQSTTTSAQPISVQNTPVVSVSTTTESTPSSSSSPSWKGRKSIGITGSGYYEINSDFSSLYYNFTLQDTNTAGFGMGAFFGYGFADRISAEISLGYSRLLYASKQRTLISENFFTADVVGHYYFLNTEKFATYGLFGIGAIIGSSAVAPVGEVGVGNYFNISDNFSIKAELLFKSAIVLNRAEGRIGVAYHF